MRHLQHIIFTIIVLFFLLLGSQAVAEEEYTCWLSAPPQDDIWVIVYWANEDGDRGHIIWKGKIPAGEKVQIKCDNGHIRYDYAVDEDQPYEGDLSLDCDSDKVFIVD